MSFICGLTGKVIPNGQKPVRVITEIRPIEYPWRPDANSHRHRSGEVSLTDDKGGRGWGIVKEVLAERSAAEAYLADRQGFLENQRKYAAEIALKGKTLGPILARRMPPAKPTAQLRRA